MILSLSSKDMWALLLLLAAEPEFIRIEPGTLKIDEINTARAGAFLIGRTEVTQAEYRRVRRQSPSQATGDQRPVENVSWHDAARYANGRSALEGLRACYDATFRRIPECNGYRLPTAAEWSLAATPPEPSDHLRAGSHEDPAALSALQTRPVATGQPNPHGLHDLHGNVWEWCEDWHSPAPLLDALRDPQGPATGVERVIKGGSYLTSRTQWNKGFVSSLAPHRRSPFTGFRLVRQLVPAMKAPPPVPQWLAQFQHPPALTSVPPVDPTQLGRIKTAWTQILGLPPHQTRPAAIRPIRQYRESTWTGQLLDLNASRILLMQPVRKPAGRLPVVIVPYYDVDSPAGENLGGHRSGGAATSDVRAFAKLAVQRGFLAVAIRWFGEGDGEGYDEAVSHLPPGLTGLGKWITEAQSLVDYLVSRPDVDPKRIGIIGHSLGGKMALYAAAFDPRIAVTVSSEPGISLSFSNYEAFWYLGKQRPPDRDQQELLALIAPRPFLLIAGESSDGQKSWPYLIAAQPAYLNPQRLGMFNHRTGHAPSPQSVTHAMDWLERFLNEP